MQIYADNAATTRPSRTALDAMIPLLEEGYGNPSSLYSIGQHAKEVLEDARAKVARAIGAQASEITFTSGGSEADTQALYTGAYLGAAKGKKHLVSTKFEHHAVLHALAALEKEGFAVTLLDIPEDGVVTVESVEAALRPDTALVSVMYANNEIGTIQPIAAIGALCKEKGVLFHTDAVQAVGHVPIDVKAQNIDMLSMSGHKFHGPKGVGALYCRRGILPRNVIYGGAQERGRRPGTENVPAIAGMAAALEEAVAHLPENAAKVSAMRDRLIEGILRIPHSALNGDAEKRLPGNANFCFEGIESESLLLLLDDRGISASSGSACTSGSLDPSHVLMAIGRPHQVANGSLRLTLGEDITAEQIDTIVEAVAQIVERLRAMSPLWRDLQEGKCQYVIQ